MCLRILGSNLAVTLHLVAIPIDELYNAAKITPEMTINQ